MISITNKIARFLEFHVLEYQNKKIAIANQYLPDYQKYMQVLDFLNWYIHSIENIIGRADISDGGMYLPFAIIGCTVDIRDASDQKKYSVFIREPGAVPSCTLHEEVSCLSSLGRSLLFQQEGQDIEIGKDAGGFSGKITRIEYDFKL
jgi:transcription elongation GreA/GreB family factor